MDLYGQRTSVRGVAKLLVSWNVANELVKTGSVTMALRHRRQLSVIVAMGRQEPQLGM